MKEKEGYVDYPEQQMILYVEKEDGKFGPMQTGSYLSANYMEDYMMKRRNLESDLRNQLFAGKISIIRYYMVLEDLTISELAARAGIRKSKVARHLDPVKAGKVSVEELTRYARVFNVPAANMMQVILFETDASTESGLILENKTSHIAVQQSGTKNPYVVQTKIKERT